MSNIPNLNEMLKLHTKKDLWERIQYHIKTIDTLRHQLEEKDKEIERLKVFEKAYYFNQTQVSQESMDLLLQNAYQVHNGTQLAIQELEKVKEWLEPKYFDYEQINYLSKIINQQIKELKGE